MTNYKESKITVRSLKNFTKKTMFKTPINKRKKDIGKITYKGYSLELYTIGNKIYSVANLYFFVEGKKFFDKKTKKHKRPTYIQILQIPYKKEYNTRFDYIFENTPIKIYSSDPSFKYYLAYALNKINAVVITNETKKNLGIALKRKPIVNNPTLHKEFNKHFYKLVEFLYTKKMNKYFDKKYFLGINKSINIK